jgi:hypothetical protein
MPIATIILAAALHAPVRTFVMRDAATPPTLVGRATPLHLIPFPDREMSFKARFADVALPPSHADARTLRQIPPRPADAPTGSAFLAATEALDKPAREEAIYAEIRRGNVPGFLRRLKPVRVAAYDPVTAEQHEGLVWVMPDYIAIGSDADFVRIPMSLPTAARLASAFRLALPTRKIVDAVYEQADVRLEPHPLSYGPEMETNAYYGWHNSVVETQLGRRRRGLLVAGHKKDVVIGLRQWVAPDRLMIYGWHAADHNPIQPLSDAHIYWYADYSHGIRFVSPDAELDGRKVDLRSEIERETLVPVFGYVPIPRYASRLVEPPLRP